MFNIDKGVISYITRDGKEGNLNVNLFKGIFKNKTYNLVNVWSNNNTPFF